MPKENRYLIHVHNRIAGITIEAPSTNSSSDIAATAVAVTRVRSARAARVVAVTGAVDLALNDHAVTAVAVMAGDKQCQQAGDEEEDTVPGRSISCLFHVT